MEISIAMIMSIVLEPKFFIFRTRGYASEELPPCPTMHCIKRRKRCSRFVSERSYWDKRYLQSVIDVNNDPSQCFFALTIEKSDRNSSEP